MDEMQKRRAQEVYSTLQEALDAQNWHYQTHADSLAITLEVNGDDIPMDFVLLVDGEREIVRMISLLPFKATEDKRIELAIATSQANFALADGCFVYDVEDGTIMFRITSSYRGSIISIDLLRYMINMACAIVDEYNDKFLAISTGALSLKEFLDE